MVRIKTHTFSEIYWKSYTKKIKTTQNIFKKLNIFFERKSIKTKQKNSDKQRLGGRLKKINMTTNNNFIIKKEYLKTKKINRFL